MKPNFGAQKLHNWWELSRAQYLTIPRSVMQDMPGDWQEQMWLLLEQLDERADWRPNDGRYMVSLVKEISQHKTTELFDPLAEYRHPMKRVVKTNEEVLRAICRELKISEDESFDSIMITAMEKYKTEPERVEVIAALLRSIKPPVITAMGCSKLKHKKPYPS